MSEGGREFSRAVLLADFQQLHVRAEGLLAQRTARVQYFVALFAGASTVVLAVAGLMDRKHSGHQLGA